jgi:uncharacterized protein (TIGR03084 family)
MFSPDAKTHKRERNSVVREEQVSDVYADLVVEGETLDRLVARLSVREWTLPTHAPRWTIAHQIAHITSTARLARASATDPATFAAMSAGGTEDFDALVGKILQPYLSGLPTAMLARWRVERAEATKALAAVPPGQLVPWVGRMLPATALASAGVMEVFAHGQDIADALGVRIERTDRIRHLVNFAVGNWQFGYLMRGLAPPGRQFRFMLTAPSGAIWELGPHDATECVTGPAVDFCLLTTRRRHRADLAMTASGPEACRWLDVAQAYRGNPGPGRLPGQFAAVDA